MDFTWDAGTPGEKKGLWHDGGGVGQEGRQAREAGSGGLVLALGPVLALLLGVKDFPWSLSRCETRWVGPGAHL